MKIEDGIKYIESEKDWKQVARADKVNVDGGLQEGFYYAQRYLKLTKTGPGPSIEFPVLIRREWESIVEDVVGEAIIVHDELASGDYGELDKFLRMECNA